jgi:hypothetical protein
MRLSDQLHRGLLWQRLTCRPGMLGDLGRLGVGIRVRVSCAELGLLWIAGIKCDRSRLARRMISFLEGWTGFHVLMTYRSSDAWELGWVVKRSYSDDSDSVLDLTRISNFYDCKERHSCIFTSEIYLIN